MNPLSHADVGVERYKEEIKQVIQIIKDINDLHDNYQYEVIVAGGEEVQFNKINVAGNTYIANYEIIDSFYKLTDNQNDIIYSEFEGKFVSYEFQPLLGNTQTGTYNGKKKSMKENYDDFIDKNGLTSSANWMDDLCFL
ncbi:hypothetical protein Barb6XT_03022 [Bacteroidales bacterium Barb6XT]|nr:hypothetical protein Barb6XT_03022 [Bacteroidales bacterium Barb6XT]